MLVAEITLNGVKKGEFVIFSKENGDWLLKEEDLKAMEVSPPYGIPVKIDSDVYYSLKAMQATEIQFDEKRLALNATFPTSMLPKKTISFLPEHPKTQLRPDDNSAYLNYSALYSGDNSGSRGILSGSLETGIHISELFFRSVSAHSVNLDNYTPKNVRYSTNITHDNRDNLQRLIIGDFSTSSGNLGTLINLAGVSFSKEFSIDPYFIRYPLAGFTGNVSSPTNARVFLDGHPLGTVNLSPGQFNMENINNYGGLRDISIVFKDSFGRETTLSNPFYFTTQNLGDGVHQYSYNAGLIRKNLGTTSNQYDGWVVSAYHIYGLNDMLTLGARGEVEQARYNIGPLAYLRFDRWGVLSASYAQARDTAGSGWAGIARYGFQNHRFNTQFQLLYKSSLYETASLLNIIPLPNFITHPKLQLNATMGYALPKIGSFSVSYNYIDQYQPTIQQNLLLNNTVQNLNNYQHIVSLAYSRSLFNSLSVQLATSKIFGISQGINLSVMFMYRFGNDVNAQLSHSKLNGTQTESFQLSNSLPIGEGVGYRIGGSWIGAGGQGQIQNFNPSLRYNGPYGSYAVDAQITHSIGSKINAGYQVGTAGSIDYVDKTLILSRPVTDSFGIVDVGQLKGVRVYQNSKEIGRTDEQGRVFIANLGSYLDNKVSINDKDIPFDYSIGAKELNVSPMLHSGSVIRFDIKRLHITQGRLRVKTGTGSQAVEYVDLEVIVKNKPQIFPTGKDGEFYLENLEPGQYHARFDRGEHCEFDLTIPDSKEMIIDLGDLYVCKFSK